MKFASAAFSAILLAMTSQAYAFCQIGDTQQCIVNGKPGIAQCDPNTHLFAPCTKQVVEITIDWNAEHQVIDGFGGAEDSAAPSLYDWPEPQRSKVLDAAFSQEKGIGLTILRSQIRPEIHPDKETWNYTDTAQVWVMKEAVSRGPVKLMASVWSPPAWMKSNGDVDNCKCITDESGNQITISCVDGAVKPENDPDFVDILSHYAGEYARANGVNIYALSPANEPSNSECWVSCIWTPVRMAAILANLSSVFAANQIGTKVIAPETPRWDTEEAFMNDTYNNPVAAARVDIAAAHLYGGNPSIVFQNALTRGKKIWQTEASTNYPVWDQPIKNALSWATLINQGLTDAQISAWLWYIVATPGSKPNGALIGLDNAAAGDFPVSKTFWALGNFSKFIRPGFVRIGTSSMPNAGVQLQTSAYKDPASGQFVIVAINASGYNVDVKFETLGFPDSAGRTVTPYMTSSDHDLVPQPAISLAETLTIPEQSIVSFVTPPANVSLHQPDGMILSTGNIYFTSHDAAGAHVFRTAQTSSPGQEIELYHEAPGNRFGDIVFAKVNDAYYCYFWAVNSAGQSTIKRIPLTGSPVATVLTPAFDNIDIVNSHHNLAADDVNLYWQDVSTVKKMPIGGGAIMTLDFATPNTPTAGVYLENGKIIYASVNAVRYVPTSGTISIPVLRTIANANAPVTTILPVGNGTYWGDRDGAIQLKAGPTISTIQAPNIGLVPTSIGTNGDAAGGPLMWTQCTSSTCQTGFDLPGGHWVSPVANNALGASMNSSGNIFWGDDYGVHRLVF